MSTSNATAGVSQHDQEADRQLKAKHRALWASGDYPAVAAELIPELGPRLVQACGVQPGQRVLDVGAGSGNAAIPAAVAGATVTASDLTPELFEAGRSVAARHGVALDWVEADAEAMPFDDNSFDIVLSCVGAMFAPHQGDRRRDREGGPPWRDDRDDQLDARWVHRQPLRDDEALRSPATARGKPGAVVGRPGTRARVVRRQGNKPQDAPRNGPDGPLCDSAGIPGVLETELGPTIATYRLNADDAEKTAALDRDFLALLEKWNQQTEPGRTAYAAEYLLVTAIKR